MRKLFIMLVVMAVVFGMSAGVMAELDSDSIDVDLIIGSYAEVGFTPGSYQLEFTEPKPDAEYEGPSNREAVFIPFSVKTNEDVNITITENMTAGLIGELGETKVWPLADNPPSSAVVSPYLNLADASGDFGAVSVTSSSDQSGWELQMEQDAGTYKAYTVFVENKWLSENGKWWELTAGTRNYTVTATVSAQ